MEQHTRQFNFIWKGLQVYCTAWLYSDGSLQRIEIDYIMDRLIDWLMALSSTNSSVVRLMRMHMLADIRREAAVQVQSAILSIDEPAEFIF